MTSVEKIKKLIFIKCYFMYFDICTLLGGTESAESDKSADE